MFIVGEGRGKLVFLYISEGIKMGRVFFELILKLFLKS